MKISTSLKPVASDVNVKVYKVPNIWKRVNSFITLVSPWDGFFAHSAFTRLGLVGLLRKQKVLFLHFLTSTFLSVHTNTAYKHSSILGGNVECHENPPQQEQSKGIRTATQRKWRPGAGLLLFRCRLWHHRQITYKEVKYRKEGVVERYWKAYGETDEAVECVGRWEGKQSVAGVKRQARWSQ